MLVTELMVFLVILSSTRVLKSRSCGSYPLKVIQGRQNFSTCKIGATQTTEFTLTKEASKVTEVTKVLENNLVKICLQS